MIYDCFTFFNELDLLEIRLNVLKDVVDRFVLVEATQTFTGRPKPLYYKENAARFAAFADRIIHVVVDDFSAAEAGRTPRERAWMSESIQRKAIARGLVGARPDDTIIISDLDEIPRPESVPLAVGRPGITKFDLTCHFCFINRREYYPRGGAHTPQAVNYATFMNPRTYAHFKYSQFVLKEVNACPSATIIRYRKAHRTIFNAGWHFTWLGGVDAIVKKLKSFAHTEYSGADIASPELVKARLENNESIFGFDRGEKFFFDRLDGSYPDYLVRNKEKYAALFYPVSDEYLERTRPVKEYYNRLYHFKLQVRRWVPKPLRKPVIVCWTRCNPPPDAV